MTNRDLFDTVLIANRGEIACRVIRTLRELGIRSVAVYSEADADARHVSEADDAICIGPAAASESYLKIDAIIDACRRSGAQAVHPGYGFLSENLDFALALEAAGITFIGPGIEALNVMGDKIRSKNHVIAAGVPVVPGIAEPGLTDAQLIAAAEDIGYPLLIKPSAGGGGKGMHAVQNAADLPATLVTARRVAAAAFGDDTLFLERLVSTPRHIEVQVLADNYGNVIHLGERECSLQRRHQKVIEEAPSALLVALDDGGATRARIGQAACNAARSVNYAGAGTVEFLVSDTEPDQFYFMEMNTRLQVEHPVTEMVTGVDLVEWQVRIAAGEALTLSQDDVVVRGHAVEARVYAEVPERDFMPSTGTVVYLDESVQFEAGVRVDSSLLQGSEISAHYDPMIAKVIAWGEDRAAALNTLDAALSDYVVLGVSTNVEYLRLLINDSDVRAGRLDTTMIERKMPQFSFRQSGDAELVAAALFVADDGVGQPAGASPWQASDGWRLSSPAPRRISLGLTQGEYSVVSLVDADQQSTAQIDAGPAVKAELSFGEQVLELDYAGATYQYTAVETWGGDGHEVFLTDGGWSTRFAVLDREQTIARMLASIQREEQGSDPEVRSPMPGTVVAVNVSNGDMVEAGTVLLAVEAMKMEHQLAAAMAGQVHITVKKGDLVKADQVLATIHTDVEGA